MMMMMRQHDYDDLTWHQQEQEEWEERWSGGTPPRAREAALPLRQHQALRHQGGGKGEDKIMIHDNNDGDVDNGDNDGD